MKNKTDKLCYLAVSLDFRNIYDVKNPNDDICEFALRRDPRAIKYIRNPSNYITQLAAELSKENYPDDKADA